MPCFSLIKHGSGSNPNVTMTFETDSLDVVRECMEDFIQGAGFVIPEKLEDDDLSPVKEKDWMWDDTQSELKIPDFENLDISFLNNSMWEK